MPNATTKGEGGSCETVVLGTITLTKLFHLVATLDGCLGRLIVVIAAPDGDGDGDLFPLVGLERTSLERIPFILVGLDEIDCFLMSPRN